MSLYLYNKTDTSFNNEGLGVLLDFVTDPEVTENINGFFELTFTYALGGHLAEHLNEEMYVSSKTNERDDEYLVFRIYESEPDYVDGSVIVRARLKQTDDFMNSIVKARTLLKGDIGFQLRSMMSNSTPTLNYRVGGTVNGVLDIEREDDNIFNMLFDDNGLFTLNGVTPKFTPEGITITKDRAWSTASVITEKNFIEQLTINTSRRDMVTQIIPFTETRRDVLTPNEDSKYHKRETIEEKVYGKPVISPKVASMGYPVITRFMEFRNDVKEELKMDETEYNTYLYESVDDLNEKAKTFFTDNEGIDEYEVEVSLETLGLHMDDYEQISSLGLYDIVEIYLEEYGVNVPVQVMEVTYSPLIGRNTQLKLTSKFNRIEHASNRINSNAPSEQELREFIQNQIINNKINETVHNFIIKDDGTKISYVNQLPPVETAIEGDVVFLVTEEGGSIWEFVNGSWVERLPLNFEQYITDQLTEVFNQFNTERTETEQAINEVLDSAKAEAERLDSERQQVIEGKFEVVNNAQSTLEQSIATAEQNAQSALQKAGASEDLAVLAKEVSENALANIGTVEAEFQTVKETTSLYERIIGKTENNVLTNVSRIAMTSELFQIAIGDSGNLVTNGNFRDGSAYGWDINSNQLNNEDKRANGWYAFTNVRDVYSTHEFNVVPNETLQVEFRAWSLSEQPFTVGILPYDQNGNQLGWTGIPLVNLTSTPTVYQGTIKVPDKATKAKTWVTIQKYSDFKDVYFNGIRISRVHSINQVNSRFNQTREAISLGLYGDKDAISEVGIVKDGVRIKGSNITLDGQVNMTSSFIVPEGNIGNLSAKKITSGTIDTARLNSADIVTKGLTSNVVKSEHILANEALFTKLFTNDLATQKLATKQAWIKSGMIDEAQIGTAQIGQIDASNGRIVNLDANTIVTGTLKGINISGGVLTALNGSVDFNLNDGQLHFKTNEPAVKRVVSGYPNQMIKFETTSALSNLTPRVWVDTASTIIGSNRYYNDYAVDDNFVGIRILNTVANSQNYVDRVDIIGDRINLTHTGFETGTKSDWVFLTNVTGGINLLYPENAHNTKHDIGSAGYPINNISTRNVTLQTSLNPNQDLVEILMNIHWHLSMIHDRTGRSDSKSSLFKKLK